MFPALKSFRAVALTVALLALLTTAEAARADTIPYNYQGWVYGRSGGAADFMPTDPGSSGRLALYNAQGQGDSRGTPNVTVAWIYASFVPADWPPNWKASTFDNAPFLLKLALSDNKSGASGSLLFPGSLSAEVWGGGATGSLGFSQTTQSLLLGDHLYTVSLNPMPSWSSWQGQMLGPAAYFNWVPITAHIEVGPAGVKDTPEPSGVALAGIGLGAFGLGALGWLRRRSPRPAGAAT